LGLGRNPSPPRKRTGANAMEQRMLAKAIKRSRYMALLPYVSPAM
jgi:ribosomal protein S18